MSSWSDYTPFATNFLGLKIYVPALIVFLGLGMVAAAIETAKILLLGALVCNAVYYANDERLTRWSDIQLERPATTRVTPLLALAYEPFSLFFLSCVLPDGGLLSALVYFYGLHRAIRLCFEQAFQVIVVGARK